jgi:citrate synthase
VGDGWLDAAAAADRLGVKVETLYAYVSRGELRRRRSVDGRRSEYAVADLDRLRDRARDRRGPRRPPGLELRSTVTTIDAEGPRYRGRLATELAGGSGFEEVAALLWQRPHRGTWRPRAEAVATARAVRDALPRSTSRFDLLPNLVAAAATADPLRRDRSPDAVVSAAEGLLATLVAVLADGATPARAPDGIATALARELAPRRRGAAALVEASLVLLADHELAASTLAARTAASARSDPYDVVLAGLAVVRGTRHGAASTRLEDALATVSGGPLDTLAAARGDAEVTPGFGHPLYPDGDPRAVRLLELVRNHAPSARLRDLDDVLAAAADRGLPAPNIDVALAAVTHVVGAPTGTGSVLFALARTVGWVAHALEQYAEPRLLRPRAVPG